MYSKDPIIRTDSIIRTDPIIRTVETFWWKKGNVGGIFFVYKKEKNT